MAFGIVENSPGWFGLHHPGASDGGNRDVQIGNLKKEYRFIFRRIGLSAFTLQTDETRVEGEAGVVTRLLVGKRQIERFEVELFGSLQIFKVELNAEELRLNSRHENVLHV